MKPRTSRRDVRGKGAVHSTRDLIILTATSGDTGSAVAHAYYGVPRVKVVVLFPIDEVSDRQRRQMTTLGGNITTIAVDGKFDDCQAMVKRAFADPELGHLRLTSANSINIGRLLPQAVYYVYAYVKLADVAAGEPIVVCVPSGNFGNMMGAVIAGRMGLPIRRLVVATNANDEVPVFWRTDRYDKIVPSRVCISNAMNVGHPSNLARLVDLYGGWMDETGLLREPPDMAALRRDIYTVSIDDDTTRATIRAAYNDFGLILEPHGAVAWAGLQQFLRDESVGRAMPASFRARSASDGSSPASFRARSASDGSFPARSASDGSFPAASASDGSSPAGTRRADTAHHQQHGPASATERSSSAGHAAAHPPNPDTPDPLAVCIETAHPAKFPDELRSLLNLDPEIPPSLAGLDQKPEHFERMTNDYRQLLTFLSEGGK